MSDQKTFADGLFIKRIETKYGEMEKLSFKVEDFKGFLDEHSNEQGFVNVNVKVSKAGKPYAELDTWKPEEQVTESEIEPEDLPF